MNELYHDTTEEEEEKDKKDAEKERRVQEMVDSSDLNETFRQEEKIVEINISGQ